MTKHSKQRDAIFENLRSRKDHPTAEEIYLSLKPAMPAISLATVYRNLAQLENEGLILRSAQAAPQGMTVTPTRIIISFASAAAGYSISRILTTAVFARRQASSSTAKCSRRSLHSADTAPAAPKPTKAENKSKNH